MRDIRSIFSEQEQRIYEKLPIAVGFYLVRNNEIEVILASDGLCDFFNLKREKVLGKIDYNNNTSVHKDDFKKIGLNIKKFVNGEIEKIHVAYRAIHEPETKYSWNRLKVCSLDLDSDARVAMATFENIDKEIRQAKIQTELKINTENEYDEVQNIFNAIIQEQTEFVNKIDEKNEKVIIIAAKNNFVGFKEGYSELTFKEYEEALKNNLNIVRTYGGKRIPSCKAGLALVKDKSNAANYILEKDGELYYKFSLTFRGREDNELYTMVYDITNVAKKEFARAEELRKANDAKNQFLSRMSHDMRTPLGAVIAMANFGIDEINDEKAREYFKEIKNFSNYLLSIMNDVLDVQKLNSNQIKLTTEIFELPKLNKVVRDIIFKRGAEENVTVVFKDDYSKEFKYIKTDKRRLEQVLINLLNNSVKYASKNGMVKGTCTYEEDGNGYLKYIIEDNGIGMSEEFQKKMFEPFTREENESIRKDGTGLGLSIVKNIIDTAGGSIECKSKLKEGTTFIIKIPLEKISDEELKIFEEKNKTKGIIKNQENLNDKQILLVEDMEINRKIAKKILMKMGLVVSLAVNGKEAVESLKNNQYDFVLMDSRMPIMDGLTATAEIRKFDQKIPIIGLSANAFLEDITKSLAVGMNDYLAKPIDRKKLTETLLKYC